MKSFPTTLTTVCLGLLLALQTRQDCLTSVQLQTLGYTALNSNSTQTTANGTVVANATVGVNATSGNYCTNLYSNNGGCVYTAAVASAFQNNQATLIASAALATSINTALANFTNSLTTFISALSTNATTNVTTNATVNATPVATSRRLLAGSRFLQTTDGSDANSTDPIVIAPAPADNSTTNTSSTDPVVIAPAPADNSTTVVNTTEPVVVVPADNSTTVVNTTQPVVVTPVPTDTTTTTTTTVPVDNSTPVTTVTTTDSTSSNNNVVSSTTDLTNTVATQALINSINTNLINPINTIRTQANAAINNCFQAYQNLMNGVQCYLTSNQATNLTTVTATSATINNFNVQVNRDSVGQQLQKCLPIIEAYCVMSYGVSINNNVGVLSNFVSVNNANGVSLSACQALRTNNCNTTACTQAQNDVLINQVFNANGVNFVSNQANINTQTAFFNTFANAFNGTLTANTVTSRRLQSNGNSTVTTTSNPNGRDVATDGSNSGASTYNYASTTNSTNNNGGTPNSWASLTSVLSVVSVLLLLIN